MTGLSRGVALLAIVFATDARGEGRIVTVVSNAGQAADQSVDRVFAVYGAGAAPGDPGLQGPVVDPDGNRWTDPGYVESGGWSDAVPAWRPAAWAPVNEREEGLLASGGDWVWAPGCPDGGALDPDEGAGRTRYESRRVGDSYDHGVRASCVGEPPDMTVFLRREIALPLNLVGGWVTLEREYDNEGAWYLNGEFQSSRRFRTPGEPDEVQGLLPGINALTFVAWNWANFGADPTRDQAAVAYAAELAIEVGDVELALVPETEVYADGRLSFEVINAGQDDAPDGWSILLLDPGGEALVPPVVAPAMASGETRSVSVELAVAGTQTVRIVLDGLDPAGRVAGAAGGGVNLLGGQADNLGGVSDASGSVLEAREDDNVREFLIVDTDGDGWEDRRDLCPLKADAEQADNDDDGVGDACDPDDDNDGVLDDGDGSGGEDDSPCSPGELRGCDDNCRTAVNRDQEDEDLDGVGDACDDDADNDGVANLADNCPAAPNPEQRDLDGDGDGDVCDVDDDGDGAGDSEDDCPQVFDPEQLDTDGDGRGDVCDDDDDGDGVIDEEDPCPWTPGREAAACSGDRDGDRLDDAFDNCPDRPNPDQHDFDRDGVGDVCDADDDNDGAADPQDPCPWTPGSEAGQCEGDRDGDGRADAQDNCPLWPNPEQTDADADGRGDPCDDDDDDDGTPDMRDNCRFVANGEDQADSDNDGVGDACAEDFDGDGIPDDGDASGFPGDRRCTSGETLGCDDNCPFVRNAGEGGDEPQRDTDGDLRGDACDDDDDDDGLADWQDVCPWEPDPEQGDRDGDGQGDACDRCPDDPQDQCPTPPRCETECCELCGIDSEAASDGDGDGVCDCPEDPAGPDNCPGLANRHQADADGDGEGDACDDDDDNDGAADAAEELFHGDPFDADTDDDGIVDGLEGGPLHGPGDDIDADGLPNALDPDSDGDGLPDGTEAGLTEPVADTNEEVGFFRRDADPATSTDPWHPDTDGGGLSDGSEDANKNGRRDEGEGDPRDGADDAEVGTIDSDGDGLTDLEEEALRVDPSDADTDDDGVADGLEHDWALDSDGDGLINARDGDSDNDGLPDGLERGVIRRVGGIPGVVKGTDLGMGRFRADRDPSSRTSMVNPDSDFGGLRDGFEDSDHDGAHVSALGEGDPLDPADDGTPSPCGPGDEDCDGLSDREETLHGGDPKDADTDDDGLPDGREPNAWFDEDRDGRLNLLDPDSDGDLLLDGTESGIVTPHEDTDPASGLFRKDVDPNTRTCTLDPDTDGGGRWDGDEDADRDGARSAGECDPLDPVDDDDGRCGVGLAPGPPPEDEAGDAGEGALPEERVGGGGGLSCGIPGPWGRGWWVLRR